MPGSLQKRIINMHWVSCLKSKLSSQNLNPLSPQQQGHWNLLRSHSWNLTKWDQNVFFYCNFWSILYLFVFWDFPYAFYFLVFLLFYTSNTTWKLGEKKSGTEKENCILKICLNYLYSHYPVITMLQTHLLPSRTFPFFLLYLNPISQLTVHH